MAYMPAFTPAVIGSEYLNDPNSANTGTANRAYLQAVTVTQRCTVTGMMFVVGTASGNMDVGLYSSTGSRLASAGSTATPTAGPRKINFSISATINPGVYYLAIVADNATASFARAGIDTVIGCYYADAAFPLPGSILLTNATTNKVLCLVGTVSGGV